MIIGVTADGKKELVSVSDGLRESKASWLAQRTAQIQAGQGEGALQEIWMAESRKAAEKALEAFVRNYQAKYPKAVAKLEKDRAELLAFYDYPAEHWRHIRTTNAIESTFATVRHRTSRTKNCVSRNSFIGLGFKMLQQAEKRWIAIFHPEKVRDLFAGVKFTDGLPANETLPDDQQSAA